MFNLYLHKKHVLPKVYFTLLHGPFKLCSKFEFNRHICHPFITIFFICHILFLLLSTRMERQEEQRKRSIPRLSLCQFLLQLLLQQFFWLELPL